MIQQAEILAAAEKRDAERKPLEVPNWGLTGERAIRFRKLDGAEYEALRKRAGADEPTEDDDSAPRSIALFVELVATCVIDAEGVPFLDDESGRALLQNVKVTPHAMLLKLADTAIEVNGLGELATA